MNKSCHTHEWVTNCLQCELTDSYVWHPSFIRVMWLIHMRHGLYACTDGIFFARSSVAACCGVLRCVAVCCGVLQYVAVCYSVLQCVTVCCSMLQCVTVCGSVFQRVATECCSVLQRVAMCCSYVAACCKRWIRERVSKVVGSILPMSLAFAQTSKQANKLQRTATHCNTIQHNTTHCNTL